MSNTNNVVITTSRNISLTPINDIDSLIVSCWCRDIPYVQYYECALLQGVPMVTIGVYAKECDRLDDLMTHHYIARSEHSFNL